MITMIKGLCCLTFFLSMTVIGYVQAETPPDGGKRGKPHIVFLITEDSLNYDAHITIPRFAKLLEDSYGYRTSVLLGKGGHASCIFPRMDLLKKADLLVVFCRRVAIPEGQMKILKAYLKDGKPLIGIRTANHAFTPFEQPEAGFEAWPEFVDSILGCKNRGYGPVVPGTEVKLVQDAVSHPVLKNIEPTQWHSNGNVYLVAPLLDDSAEILATGEAEGNKQPVAWTRLAGRSRVFYTSMGYPDDFELSPFRQLLLNGIAWALRK